MQDPLPEKLAGRQLLIGVTGGIAACKAALLIHQLRLAGADLRVVMTEAATQFITPLTLQALADGPVYRHLLAPEQEAAMGHIALARWAEAIIVVPASADFLARLCHGRSNDLLAAVCLASKAPLVVVPAMNQGMWSHVATQDNVALLKQRGVRVLGPAAGLQACGDYGAGRLPDTDWLEQHIYRLFCPPLLAGKRVLITAGPTQEDIDPVRYIGNRSSGRMGYALAAAAADAGAEVTLVSGPCSLNLPAGVHGQAVRDARAMARQVAAAVEHCDLFIACAAVTDFRVAKYHASKRPHASFSTPLALTANPDVLAAVSALPLDVRPYVVGFAAQSGDPIAAAKEKLRAKGADMIAANDIDAADGGFGSTHNRLELLFADGRQESLAHAPKSTLAQLMIARIAQEMVSDAA